MPYITLEIENGTPNQEGYIVVNPKMSVTPDGFQAHELLIDAVAAQACSDNPLLKWAPTLSPEDPIGWCGLLRPKYQLLIKADVSREELQRLLPGLEIGGYMYGLKSSAPRPRL